MSARYSKKYRVSFEVDKENNVDLLRQAFFNRGYFSPFVNLNHFDHVARIVSGSQKTTNVYESGHRTGPPGLPFDCIVV